MTTVSIGTITIEHNPSAVARLMGEAVMDLDGTSRRAMTYRGLNMSVSRAIGLNLLPVSVRMEIEDTTDKDGSIGVSINMAFKEGHVWNDFKNGRIQSTIVHTTHNRQYWAGDKIEGRIISKETLAVPFDTNQPFMEVLLGFMDDQWEEALIEAGY